jgi:ferredoxin
MTVYINTADCNGCGGCEELCPDIFKMDEYGEKPEILRPDADDDPDLDQAIAYCPQEAIIKD